MLNKKRYDEEIQHQALLEAHERCCENCRTKHWGGCQGIRRFFESVNGCKKVLEVYSERFHKLNDWKKGYD